MEVKGHIGVGVVSAHRVLLENVLLQGTDIQILVF